MRIGDRVIVNYPPRFNGAPGAIVEKQKYIGLPFLVACDDGRKGWFGPNDLRREAE